MTVTAEHRDDICLLRLHKGLLLISIIILVLFILATELRPEHWLQHGQRIVFMDECLS